MGVQSINIRLLLLAVVLLISIACSQINMCEAVCIRQKIGEHNCPKDCNCIQSEASNQNGMTIDCSKLSLIQIPDIPENTTDFRFDSNKLLSINEKDFKGCFSLKYLSLAYNAIQFISQGSFDDLTNLQEMHLNNNHLTLNGSLNKMLFNQLHSLKVLLIHRNSQIPEDLLSNLTKLERLTFDRNMETLKFPSFFLNFTKLTSLELYGSFRKMPNESFRNFLNVPLREIKILAVKNGGDTTITDIHPLAFSNLTHLETLDLSENRGIGFGNASNAVYGLCGSSPLKTLILSQIVRGTDIQSKLTTKFYDSVRNCDNLTKVCFDKNYIITMAPGFAKAMSKVEYVDFSYNRMSNVQYVFVELSRMKKLRYLDFSYQNSRYHRLPAVQKRSVALKDNFTVISSSYREEPVISSILQEGGNSSQEAPSDGHCWGTFTPCRYPSIFVATQDKTIVPLSEDGPWCIPIPKQLEVINATSSLNVGLARLPVIILLNGFNSKLRYVSFGSNGLRQMAGPILFGMSRQGPPLTIDVAGNGMDCVAPNVFKRSKSIGGNIGTLILERNNLGDQLASDSSGRTFEQFEADNVTVLNLASNNIKALQISTFIHLSVLRELNLSSNSLRMVEFNFSHMRRLNKLDLSYNLISSLNEPILSHLDALFLTNNLTLYLSGNPIQCSCETLPFLNWVDLNQENIKNLSQTSCFLNNTQVSFNRLSINILTPLKFQCATNLILKLSVTLLGGTVFTIALSVFLYRHRWDIKYWFLSFRSKVPHKEEIYEYHAFVSHDHHDMQFVLKLVERLENSFGSTPQQLDSTRFESTYSTYFENSEEVNAENNDESLQLTDQQPLCNPIGSSIVGFEKFKLCVSQRDFTVGEGIEENILRAIRSSRKVIVVLSKSFLKSRWCNFELEMSRVESVNRGYSILVPVMLEELNVEDMSTCLKWLVRQVTYLEWSENEMDREEFWKNLLRVLRKPGRECWEVNS